MTRRGCRAVFGLLLLAVVYLSWKPYPSIAEVPWMPAPLGLWLDQHDFSKNLLGYGVFALFGFIGWAASDSGQAPARSSSISRSVSDPKLLLCFGLVVVTLELGQLVLLRRTCDLADIFAGWSGILLAWVVFRLAQLTFKRVGPRR